MLLDVLKNLTRRDLFRAGGLAALAGGSGAQAAPALRIGSDIFQSIGVRPMINCRGTFTIITGSQTLPEVKRAMEEASRHYVHMDELMDAVGARLAELTGAEWGVVTAGCAAALAHATAACIAGTDPEKMQRLPDLRGLKNEVISPRWSRNEYDHAIRMIGVKMIDVSTREEYEAAFNKQTAMVMVLAGSQDRGPVLGLDYLSEVANKRGVPVLVDAAAEKLTIPNVHLQRGATMVAYSGGKCIRGPQCAGLLLGRKDLVHAAWINSAPHHAAGRAMKVGKEEIMGMLAAVEMWVKRDHDAEWKQWESWLEEIATKVKTIDGVSTEVSRPQGLSNHAPRLRVSWDGAKLGITGAEVERLLLDTEPRVVLANASGDRRRMQSSVGVMPYMMMPGEAKVVAARLHALLSKPPKFETPPIPAPSADVAGQWEVDIEYTCGKARHGLVFEQRQNGELVGTHTGDILSGDLRGAVEGDQVQFRSTHRYEGKRLGYAFTGRAGAEGITGTVDVGEYGKAKFVARRRRYNAPFA